MEPEQQEEHAGERVAAVAPVHAVAVPVAARVAVTAPGVRVPVHVREVAHDSGGGVGDELRSGAGAALQSGAESDEMRECSHEGCTRSRSR